MHSEEILSYIAYTSNLLYIHPNPINIDEVEEAILKLITEEKLRLEMSERCSKTVELLSMERGLKDEVEMLNMVLQGRNK
ncbi:MAG: hypothetical protein QW756_02065 [Nitrososphaerota archaeon]